MEKAMTIRDILRANCPNDVAKEYSFHRIELHCSWYIAITKGEEILHEAIVNFLEDMESLKIYQEWCAIREETGVTI